MKPGLIIALVGLGVAALDFWGYARHADVWFRNFSTRTHSWDRWTDATWDRIGQGRAILTFAGIVLVASTVLSLLADGPVRVAVSAIWGTIFGLMLLILAIAVWGTVFIFVARWICLALAWPKRGILTTVGLVLSVIGVAMEAAGSN